MIFSVVVSVNNPLNVEKTSNLVFWVKFLSSKCSLPNWLDGANESFHPKLWPHFPRKDVNVWIESFLLVNSYPRFKIANHSLQQKPAPSRLQKLRNLKVLFSFSNWFSLRTTVWITSIKVSINNFSVVRGYTGFLVWVPNVSIKTG